MMTERISIQLLHIVAVILLCAVRETIQIRVDYNTNHGPIIPPTVTPRPAPQPPFRSPAPVWEDSSNDIPNPNPYYYLPPPPSRPRYNDFELTNSIDDTNRRYDIFHPSSHVISQPQQYQPHQQQPYPQPRYTNTPVITNVPSLSVKYIPNVGYRYFAVVPIVQPDYTRSQPFQQSTASSTKHFDKYAYEHEKTGGKYNPKLKKYKVYEKKYVPSYVPNKQQQQQQQVISTTVPSSTTQNTSNNNINTSTVSSSTVAITTTTTITV